MTDEAKFGVGDVVKLKSAPMRMTVKEARDMTVTCIWFDREDRLCEHQFLATVLEQAGDDDPDQPC